MFIKCIVLGLAFVAFAWAETSELTDSTLLNVSQEPECSSNLTAEIYEISANMKMCFDSLILHNGADINCAKMEDWTAYKKLMSDALMCSQINRTMDITELEKGFGMTSDLVKFMFQESKNSNFPDLLNKTKICINSTKTQITGCISSELGVENVTYVSDFPLLMASLDSANLPSACDDANRTKSCVLKRLNESTHCLPETIRFTEALFNVAENIMQACNNTNTTSPDALPVVAAKLSTTAIVFIVLGVLLAIVAIIGVVCYKAYKSIPRR